MKEFDWQTSIRTVFGAGRIDQLGDLAAPLGGRRPLVVTDPGIEAPGHVDRAMRSLIAAGMDPVIFDGVEENPTTRHVQAGLEFARAHNIDMFIGLGGGSAMDVAKGINFLLTNGGQIADYWGSGKAQSPMLPFVAIPTTAGTGSEAQSFALIADETTHVKMACGDKKAAAKIAILDPELTVSQPPRVAAVSGIDAISHAIESWVTLAANPVSSMFARQAWRLLSRSFPRMLESPTDLGARGDILLGAHWAGHAIECSMLGAAHAAANPLTARFNVTHGLAVGVLLPHVIHFNAVDVADRYAELDGECESRDAAARLGGQVVHFLQQCGLPNSLEACGVDAGAIPAMAKEAKSQWTARFNPRTVSESDFEQFYRDAYNGGANVRQ